MYISYILVLYIIVPSSIYASKPMMKNKQESIHVGVPVALSTYAWSMGLFFTTDWVMLLSLPGVFINFYSSYYMHMFS